MSTTKQHFALVEKLLACPCLSDISARRNLVRQLPDQIKHKISYPPEVTAIQEMSAILYACLKVPDGWDALLERISSFDGAEALSLDQLKKFAASLDFEALRSALVLQWTLRPVKPPPEIFSGRDNQLERLGQLLKPGCLVNVWGMAGVGKSSLAWTAVHRDSLPAFSGGVLSLDLAQIREIARFSPGAAKRPVRLAGTAGPG